MDGEYAKYDSRIYTAMISQPLPHPYSRWDRYFHHICEAVSTKSSCLSRKIGAILVKDHSVITTGYNGPPRGTSHCLGECPRQAKGYKSGEGLLECPATHAEGNCVANAARMGVSVYGSTLYMNSIIPCKDCTALLINAGVAEFVVDDIVYYHEMSKRLINEAHIIVRRFEL